MEIKIAATNLEWTAVLHPNATAEAIGSALPLQGSANVWGEEIYFEIPLALPMATDAVEEVEVGTLAYWPMGRALCIFFGTTPVSTGKAPRAYSPVNVFGHILEGAAGLKKIAPGDTVTITALK